MLSGPGLLLAPLLVPLTGAIVAGMLRPRGGAWTALVASVGTAVSAALVLDLARRSGPVVYAVGGWPAPLGIVLVADVLGACVSLLAALLAVSATLHSVLARADYAERRHYHSLFLLLLVALGGVFLTGDLFNLYVFMELAILSSFPLVATAARPISPEATFKYAVLSGIGSAMLLGAVALVYASLGTLNLADIAARRAEQGATTFDAVAAAILLTAFLLKAAVFPFHFWQPDAHSAAPAPISAMLSGMLVKVGIYGIIRLQTLIFVEEPLLAALAPIGAVAAVFGALAALSNADLKRMLAYSTISNMGLIVLALGWGEVGMVAAVVHLINHALIKAGLFLAGGWVVERSGVHEMRRLGGVACLSPAAAYIFGIGAVALAGLPPTNGFMSKFAILRAGLEAGTVLQVTTVAIASAIGIAYPLLAFVRVFWGRTAAELRRGWPRTGVSPASLVAPALLAAACVLLGVWPAPVFDIAQQAATELLDPEVYIHAVLRPVR